jgi:signal transduction histidine kinase
VTNAIQYNHKGGTVALTCIPSPPGQVRIVVRDSGPGIAQDRLERIFEPFEGAGKAPEGRHGIGMSLALSRKLVEAMGGKLGVVSRLGAGSEFLVDLPEADPPFRAE